MKLKYPNPKTDPYTMYFEDEMWDFCNRYLDTYDHNSLCDRNKTPEHYYLSLITHFLSTQFGYEDEPIPEEYKDIKIVNDLPPKIKIKSIDCLGCVLGLCLGTNGNGKGFSVLPAIYRGFNNIIDHEIQNRIS